MSYHTKYELDKLVHDGPVKTFQAKEIASGKPVFLHLFSGGEGRGADLLEKALVLQQLSGSTAGEQPIVEIGEQRDYVATEVLESFQGLETWVDAAYEQAQAQAKDRRRREMRTWIASGNVAAALEATRHGAEAFPDEPRFADVGAALGLLVESRRLAEQGKHAECVDLLRQAAEIDPGNPLVRGGLLEVLTKNAEALEQTEPQEAERLEQQDDRHGAEALLEQGLTKYPDEKRLRQRGTSHAEPPPPAMATPPAGPPEPKPQHQGLSTPKVLGKQARQGARVAAKTARLLVGKLRERLPALAASLSKLDRRGPLIPATLGAGIAAVLIPLIWLFGDFGVEADIPPLVIAYTVALSSSPAGATLSIDGEQCGMSNCDVELAPGTHFAKATLPGYRSTIVPFDVGQDDDAEPVVLALSPLPPTIRISSDLASGTVELDGEPIGDLEEGEFERQLGDLSPGEHVLTVSERGATASVTFEMAPASIPILRGPPETRDLRSVVVAGFSSLAKVYSDREITSVQLDGRDIEGDAVTELHDLAPGTHELAITAGGNTRKVDFDSLESPVLATFIQSDRNVGGLRIDTGEDGVSVYLNGEKYRRETRRGRLLIYLYPKTYSVRVEKDGFRPSKEQTVEVRKGERVALDFKLEPLPTTATLRIRNSVPGAQVLLDEKGVGVIGPDGTLSVSNVTPGKRKIVLRKEKFEPREIEREFVANGSVEISGALESALGTLRVELTPADADARLTLRREGENTDRPISDLVLRLEAGTYTVSASAAGFKDYGATLRLGVDETKTARIVLERIIVANPTGPSFQLADWEKAGGWFREGDLIVRTGGDYFLAPFQPEPGVFEFAAIVRRGRRLEWAVDFHTKQDHLHYQIGKDYFERSKVTAGRRSENVRERHAASWGDYIAVRIDIRSGAITTSLYEQDKWTEIDRYTKDGVDLSDGRFGLYLPGRRQIGVRRLTFTAR